MKYKTKPYAHQLQCLERFSNHAAFALTAEMGTGKTWIAMMDLAQHWLDGQCDAALVMAPNGVHDNWVRRELPKHMPEAIAWKALAWKPKKSVQEALTEFCKPTKPLRIFTMNWEAMSTEKGFEMAKAFCERAKRLAIICDESDEMKNPKAGRTKAMMRLRCYSEWRRILTGTPFDGTPFSAFSQYNFLDPKILNCTNYAAFKSRYAEMLKPGNPLLNAIIKNGNLRFVPQVVEKDKHGRPKYRDLDKLSAILAPHTFRVLKKDCLDLPEKIYKTVSFDMTLAQWKVYRKAEKENRLAYEGNDTPFARLTIANKLSQITSGYYLHPHSEEPVRIPGANPKLELLRERVRVLMEAGESVIIWARYTVQILDIAKALTEDGHRVVTYYGDVDSETRSANIDAFERGEAKVFIGNQQAGGTGITLVAASYVIYFSNNFRLRDRLQSEDRAHRIGQTKNVTYVNFIANETVDEEVVEALINKQEVSEMIQSGAIRVIYGK